MVGKEKKNAFEKGVGDWPIKSLYHSVYQCEKCKNVRASQYWLTFYRPEFRVLFHS